MNLSLTVLSHRKDKMNKINPKNTTSPQGHFSQNVLPFALSEGCPVLLCLFLLLTIFNFEACNFGGPLSSQSAVRRSRTTRKKTTFGEKQAFSLTLHCPTHEVLCSNAV